MPKLPVHRRVGEERGTTIIGPCPGCELWTVEYQLRTVFACWSAEEFNAVIEALLREHLAECSGLREIAAAAGLA